jgi:uncharacterized protein
MVVVSDTTALSNLYLCEKLWILERLFTEILIPDAVIRELEKMQEKGWDISAITDVAWIKIVSVSNQDVVIILSEVLDEGEAEAIALAKEYKADLLIIDEIKGRKYAKKLNIPIIGLVGILIQAKQEGIIDSVENILVELQHKAGFWISTQLFEQALILAGER